jgi:hypothetical protein
MTRTEAISDTCSVSALTRPLTTGPSLMNSLRWKVASTRSRKSTRASCRRCKPEPSSCRARSGLIISAKQEVPGLPGQLVILWTRVGLRQLTGEE